MRKQPAPIRLLCDRRSIGPTRLVWRQRLGRNAGGQDHRQPLRWAGDARGDVVVHVVVKVDLERGTDEGEDGE